MTLSADLPRSPTLDRLLRFELAQIGVGAIGTAIALSLSELVLVLIGRRRRRPRR